MVTLRIPMEYSQLRRLVGRRSRLLLAKVGLQVSRVEKPASG